METSADRTQVEVTINNPSRVLHFCDGVEEEGELQKEEVTPLNTEPDVDPSSLTWVPWLSHYAWKSGNSVLNAVDYAGEGLANFFGITTPKYQMEIDEYERIKEEKKKMDEDSAGWVPRNDGGDIPLVLNEPSKEIRPTA